VYWPVLPIPDQFSLLYAMMTNSDPNMTHLQPFLSALTQSFLNKDKTWPSKVGMKEGTVQRVFSFQGVIVNYMRGCPLEAVRDVYYGAVVKDLIGERYSELKAAAMHEEVISKIALLGLIDVMVKNLEVEKVQGLMVDILSSIHRDSYLVYFVKHGL